MRPARCPTLMNVNSANKVKRMKFKALQQEWGELRFENVIGRITIPILAIGLVIAVVALMNQKPIVTVLPPSMTEEATIAHDDANEATKRAYGTYVVQMMGNVHPGTVDFLITSLEDMLHPSIYHEVKEDVMDQVSLIQQEDLAISFEPRTVDYWEDTNRVVVHGNRVTRGRGQETMMDRVTYEVEIEISNYLPQVTFVSVYEGRPERNK